MHKTRCFWVAEKIFFVSALQNRDSNSHIGAALGRHELNVLPTCFTPLADTLSGSDIEGMGHQGRNRFNPNLSVNRRQLHFKFNWNEAQSFEGPKMFSCRFSSIQLQCQVGRRVNRLVSIITLPDNKSIFHSQMYMKWCTGLRGA